jgi:DNA gyrase subunit A
MATKNGIIKKTGIEEFANVRRSGLIAVKLKKDDELRWVRSSNGNNNIIIASSGGQSIRFKEKDIRSMGRSASGVKAIKLKPASKVISMDVVFDSKKEKRYIFTISENGFGKLSDLKFYKIQHRGGSGIKTAIINAKTGPLVSSRVISENQLNEDLLLISRKGQVIRTPFSNIAKSGRATQGVRVMRLSSEDKVSSIAVV